MINVSVPQVEIPEKNVVLDTLAVYVKPIAPGIGVKLIPSLEEVH